MYNWEVITQEPYVETFAVRDSILQLITWEIIAVSLVDLLIAYIVFFVLTPKNHNVKGPAPQKQK